MKAIATLKSILFTLFIVTSPAIAEDIDLFLGWPADASGSPNVLFVIDNSANWSRNVDEINDGGRTQFHAQRAALAAVFEVLPEDVNVGVMMYAETGNPNNSVSGGYVRAAIRSMAEGNNLVYRDMIASLGENDDKGSNATPALAMAEAFMYFDRRNPIAGNGKEKTDYTDNTAGLVYGTGKDKDTVVETKAWQHVYELEGNALSGKDTEPYLRSEDEACARNFVIFVSNGAPDNNNDEKSADGILQAVGGNTSVIQLPNNSGLQDNWADEWARFMYQSGQSITTFTIDVNPTTKGQGPNWTSVLESMARESGGIYYSAAPKKTEIEGIFKDIFSRILSVNSVFASVALPASANAQSRFLNQVFIGMFRPDEQANPRWVGNLKQYKFGFDETGTDSVLRVLDRDNKPIVDTLETGFILDCANSFWTPEAPDTYWSFLPEAMRRGACYGLKPTPAEVEAAQISNTPDGPVVEKGGQAYVMRSRNPGDRVIKTCAATIDGCDELADFDSTVLTASALGVVDDTESAELIDWARGKDLDNERDPDGEAMRPSIHGDVIHSQPVAIDYSVDVSAPLENDSDNPQVVVFYGANDGFLRAINGNREGDHNSVSPGEEIWSFMPPEFFDEIKRIRDNEVTVKFPASGPTSVGAEGQPKPYGVDGAITSFERRTGVVGEETRHIYFGLRRGGRSVYGFNVSDIASPTLMWRKGCGSWDDDDCSSATLASDDDPDWTQIGQTWSPISPAELRLRSMPVLIFGGGYDSCEDIDNGSSKNHDCDPELVKGNVIYVIDSETGALLKSFSTDRPVVGKVTTVPYADLDRATMFAYAADTGGNIYRISGIDENTPIDSTPPSQWTIKKIASLGCDTYDDVCDRNRKFLFGPDVVRIVETDKLGVMIGSGDREKPLVDYGAANQVSNYFYGIIDRPTVPSWLDDVVEVEGEIVEGPCGADIVCMDALSSVTTAGPVEGGPLSPKGWKLAMRPGEQVVSGALTVSSVVNFSSHIPAVPDAEACTSNTGTATTYNVGFDSGEGERINILGGGLVPTPVAGKVILDNGRIVPFCIGCGGEGSAIGGSQVTSSTSWLQHRSRVYWNVEK